MKKVVILFVLILFSFTGSTNYIFSKEIVPAANNVQNDDYIYVKVVINGITYIYVYLSDGVTLVNIYEEED